jgi:hypothetical protein
MIKDEQRNKYYLRKYNISLNDYREMLRNQQGCCAICKKHHSEFKNALSVDHDHRVARSKITTKKQATGSWLAKADIDGRVVDYLHATRSIAIQKLRRKLLTLSVRGLLCWQDNTAIQKFRDNADRMDRAAQYIRRYQKCLTLG